MKRLLAQLEELDRRVVYLLVMVSLALPLILGFSIPPAPMKGAENSFAMIEKLDFKPGQVVFISLDFGPNSYAENGTQAEVLIEHLMRRGLPLVLFTQYIQGAPFLNSIPEKIAAKLNAEDPNRALRYGKSWVNLGFRIGADFLIQGASKSENLLQDFKTDARGNDLKDLPAVSGMHTLRDIGLLVQVTGLLGTVENYIRFFQLDDYRPPLIHGCTSITIPKAYIYLDSGQIAGVLEGIAGAAWYEQLMIQAQERSGRQVEHKTPTQRINTGLAVAHLVIIALILLGNFSHLFSQRLRRGA